jgi:3-methyladenine DNA glycosylase/8-oxoguanine DNA glycosylase
MKKIKTFVGEFSNQEFSEQEEFSKEFSEFSDQEDFIKEWFEECGSYPSKDLLEVRKISLRRLSKVKNTIKNKRKYFT